MQKIFRRLSAALLCLALLAVPALAAEATIRSDYVVIEGENFVADTFCGVDALYNETGRTLFCNELIERFYSAVYGVSMYTDNGSLTVTSPSGCWFEVTYAPQPGDIAYASAEARERYGNHYAIVKSVDEAGGTVTLFEQNWIWDGKAGVNRVIPYDGGCYTFYTMMSASGRAAAAEEGKSKGVKGLPMKLGMEMAAEMIAKIKDEHLCDGVHIMAIGAEKNVPAILDLAGITI